MVDEMNGENQRFFLIHFVPRRFGTLSISRESTKNRFFRYFAVAVLFEVRKPFLRQFS